MDNQGPTPPEPSLIERCHRVSRWYCLAVFVIGSGVFVCWLGRPWLSAAPGSLWSMKANAALCIAATGGSLLLLQVAGSRWRIVVGASLAAMAAAIAAATLVEYAARLDLGIDTLLAHDPSPSYPGRMFPQTAAYLAILGVGVLCSQWGPGVRSRLCDVALVASGILLHLMLTGQQTLLYGTSELTRVAPHTLAALLLMWIALFTRRIGIGILSLPGGAGIGSLATRFLLPVTVALPILMGGLRLWGEALGLYTSDLGLAVFTTVQSVVLITVIFVFGMYLNRMEARYRKERSHREELERMVVICAWTRNVQWNGQWVPVEVFLKEKFGLAVTHGISAEAMEKELTRLQATGGSDLA